MPTSAYDRYTLELSSPSGLRATLNANGSLRRLDCGAIALALFVGNEIEGGPANLYLRHHGDRIEWIPLLGPSSPTRFSFDPQGAALVGRGSWGEVSYVIELTLAAGAAAWFWRVQLDNRGATAKALDLTYAQDLALAPYGAIRLNEFYVSQYIDHRPLQHPLHGYVLASRQNQAVDSRNPVCLIGSLRSGRSFATDALQFHGLASRAGDTPIGLTAELPGERLQHEHSMAIIRDSSCLLAPKQSIAAGFFGAYRADHPAATSSSDLKSFDEVYSLPESAPSVIEPQSADVPDPATLFSAAPLLASVDLDEKRLRELFGAEWRHEERDERGERLSFFHGAESHVVLRA